VSYGACAVYSYTGQSVPNVNLTTTVLDAGAAISVNGPKGAKSIPKGPGGVYVETLSSTADYLDTGLYTVSGGGGAGAPGFTAQTTVAPALVWTNQSSGSTTTVIRANGLPITWTGGDPNGSIQINGTSFVFVNATFAGASFVCSAKTSAGAFTVPSVVLLALPASGSISGGAISVPLPGTLTVSAGVASTASVPGLDFFTVSSAVGIGQSATYQ
jgi:hypothetical protein